MERKGEVIACRWAEDEKGAGTNSGKSGTRNLEANGYQKQSGEYGRECKADNSHRAKTEQRA